MGSNNISKKKIHTVNGRVHPIPVYEICLSEVMYFIIVDGYKAGMSPEFYETDDGQIHIKKCRASKNGHWSTPRK